VTRSTSFSDALNERFFGVLDWSQLQALWATVRRDAGAGWYLYAIGEALPEYPRSANEIERFLDAIDTLLRHDLRDDSCTGVVYTDNRDSPQLIKIYDPFHMGSACSRSQSAPLPGWILTRLPPTELKADRVLPENRRRWWRELWSPAPVA